MTLLHKTPNSPDPSSTPWPSAIIVIVVVVATTTLVLIGHPAAAAIGVVGGAGLAGLDIARRLSLPARTP